MDLMSVPDWYCWSYLDRVKTIAYAEGDSKWHSVERYHVAENWALSQHGRIDSHALWRWEVLGIHSPFSRWLGIAKEMIDKMHQFFKDSNEQEGQPSSWADFLTHLGLALLIHILPNWWIVEEAAMWSFRNQPCAQYLNFLSTIT